MIQGEETRFLALIRLEAARRHDCAEVDAPWIRSL
jgi:hypothetical protein